MEKNILIDAFKDEKSFDNKCTGCFACFSICPVYAIDMIDNSEGFLYPSITNEICIRCKKCVLVCPALRDEMITNPIETISVCSKSEEMIMKSSSGGIVGEVSKNVLSKNGKVFGAVFNPRTKSVEHNSSENFEIDEILRSKYVQSSINDTYIEVKEDLDNNKLLLYTGTPCQIHGLNNYLNKEYENLITIDFICHGVPSPGLFRKTIENIEVNSKSEIKNVTFREKDLGWEKQCMKFYFSNGKVKRYRSRFFYYYQLFINNFSLRRSCYLCEYYNNHVSDITLADNWKKANNMNLGDSIAFINTKKGKKAISEIENQITITDGIMDIDYDIYKHGYPLENRRKFFNNYIESDSTNLINQYKYIGYKHLANRILQRLRLKNDKKQ